MDRPRAQTVPAEPRLPGRRTFLVLTLVLCVAGLWGRLGEWSRVVTPQGLAIHDPDTVRRLARIEALRAIDHYPAVETADGFPQGSVSHWTLPMDWWLWALDPLVGWAMPRARPCEAAAVLSGPLLALGALLVFLWAARRLVGDGPALAAAAFYTLALPARYVSMVGNGDHQNLQHLALLAFVMLALLRLAGRAPRGAAVLSGLALGLAIWISTESLIVLFLWGAASAALCVLPLRLPAGWFAGEAVAAATAGAVTVCACLVEQGGGLGVEWDKVSWMQVQQVGTWVLLAGVAARLGAPRRWLAVPLALAAGLAVLFLVPGFAAAVQRELDRFAVANAWVQSSVDEYRAAFKTADGYGLAGGLHYFTWLLPLLLLGLLATPFARRAPSGVRLAVTVLGAGTFAAACSQIKLGHMFWIVAPLLPVIGGVAVLDRLRLGAGARRALEMAAAALLVAAPFGSPAETSATQGHIDLAREDLCRFLAERSDGSGSVLAPWDLGAHLMYRGRTPVVASGYHRNIDGIHDALRFYLAQPAEAVQAQALLARRKVRWVVAWFDRMFLAQAPKLIGSPHEFLVRTADEVRVTEQGMACMFWRLRFGIPVPGLRPAYQSPIQVQLAGAPPMPFFVVYEVMR